MSRMKRNFSVIMVIMLTLSVFSQSPNRTVGFNHTISGSTNYATLSEAIQGATAGTTIWVAAGTYSEDEIIVPTGVTIIGGFPASASAYSERIYPGNATTAQQSVLDANYAHRVATVYGTLDGFIITKGYVYAESTEDPINAAGGGVLIDGGIVQNSIIKGNIASKIAIAPTALTSYTASIGDIYFKGLNGSNDTIVKPVYTLNSNTGKVEATLAGGLPANKTAQGIVFYVDPDPSVRKITIVGQRSPTTKTWSGDYTFDSPLSNVANASGATADMAGQTNSTTVINYVNGQIPTWNATYQTWRTTSWQTNAGFRYIETFNTPSGTLGQWYLPAAGELIKLTDVRAQMDAAGILLGWISSSGTMFPNHVYMSSTENNSSNYWGFNAYSGWQNLGISKIGKTAPGYAFPVTIKTY